MGVRFKVLNAIFRRNLSSYFSGVLGYLFIVVFVMVGAALAFDARFFTANEPNLDQLTQWYPVLLLFFVPSITMGVWSDERKTGTDELLFTLPATDLEILLGKYFAALAVYSVALLFSTSYVVVLLSLGQPDLGLLLTTYFGYWLVGAALLSAGMLASLLTNNMTVAFVLGIIGCAIPVFLGQFASLLDAEDSLGTFGMGEQFRDFGMGIVPLSSLVYFVSLAVLMLYLNLVVMSRRHWDSNRAKNSAVHYLARATCLCVIVICVTVWARSGSVRVDATSEKLFTLSEATRTTVTELESDRPIEIQAFISPEVPREYVETRKQLVGLLRQFDEMGGKNLKVRFVDVEPDSEEAEEAEFFGIAPQTVLSDQDGRRTQVDVFMGAVVISSYDKVVVPFFGKGLPIEYELTRSVRTVSQEKRLTVGILDTDAQILGQREWQIARELRQQYDVEPVSPDAPIDAAKFDVLIAVMPSSLTEPQMDNFVSYVKRGKPVLIFDDPFPITLSGQFGVSNAPSQPKPSPGGGGGMFGQQPPPGEPKADRGRATRLLDALGVDWKYNRVVFDTGNPHQEFDSIQAEYVFITKDAGGQDAISAENEVTADLQELIVMYAGDVTARSGSPIDFIPLLSTGKSSGQLEWDEFTEMNGMGMMMGGPPAVSPKANPLRDIKGDTTYTIAAKLEGGGSDKINAIFVADVDMISDFFFQERTLANLGIQFDNVSFTLNAVDHLAGEDRFITLRSRRPRHRTLKRFEEEKQVFEKEASGEEKTADEAAEKELEERKAQLSARVAEIQANEGLDPIAKQQMVLNAQRGEQQRLELAEAQIEQEKELKMRKIRSKTNRKVRSLETRFRWRAVAFPPIPPLLLGIFVFIVRWKGESQNIDPARRRS
jgi:ABC-2 type transport system permease protein